MLHLRLTLWPATLAITFFANGIEATFGGETQLSYLTISGEIGSSDLLTLPGAIPEGIVVFMGGNAGSTPSSAGGGPVISINADLDDVGNQDRPAQAKEIPDLLSAGIVWPDKDGQIVTARAVALDGRSPD